MLSFNNDPKLKEFYVNRMLEHAEADEIIQGTSWENGKGCFIGCSFNKYQHNLFESEIGAPLWLAKLADRIFEGLSKSDAQWFAREFYSKMPVGKDLDKIKNPFLIFVVESTLDKFDHNQYPKVKKAIDGVLKELRKDVLDLDKLREAMAAAAVYAADAAAAAVYDADAAAVYAAAGAGAAAAVYDADAATAAVYAADAAAAAVYDATAAVYAAGARHNMYKKFADKLFELMEGLK